MTLFSLSPGSRFNRKELKERTILSNLSLDKALANLTSSGVLKREKSHYSVDFENPYSKMLLEVCGKQHKQMKEIPLDVYFLLADAVEGVSMQKGIELFLFGSYSKLVYKKDSDVDIAVLHGKRIDKTGIKNLFLKLEKRYGKSIEIHFFEKSGFYRNKRDPLVKGIIKDGILLLKTR